jgi:hypothetical protein
MESKERKMIIKYYYSLEIEGGEKIFKRGRRLLFRFSFWENTSARGGLKPHKDACPYTVHDSRKLYSSGFSVAYGFNYAILL